MNKQILSIFVFALFTSCASSDKPNPIQVSIDSAIKAKTMEHQAKKAVYNDSVLNALAASKADSIEKEVHTNTNKK